MVWCSICLYQTIIVKRKLNWKISVHQWIYVPTLTSSHELWVVTETMRLWTRAAEISFLRELLDSAMVKEWGAQRRTDNPSCWKEPAEGIQFYLVRMPLGLLRSSGPAQPLALIVNCCYSFSFCISPLLSLLLVNSPICPTFPHSLWFFWWNGYIFQFLNCEFLFYIKVTLQRVCSSEESMQ